MHKRVNLLGGVDVSIRRISARAVVCEAAEVVAVDVLEVGEDGGPAGSGVGTEPGCVSGGGCRERVHVSIEKQKF